MPILPNRDGSFVVSWPKDAELPPVSVVDGTTDAVFVRMHLPKLKSRPKPWYVDIPVSVRDKPRFAAASRAARLPAGKIAVVLLLAWTAVVLFDIVYVGLLDGRPRHLALALTLVWFAWIVFFAVVTWAQRRKRGVRQYPRWGLDGEVVVDGAAPAFAALLARLEPTTPETPAGPEDSAVRPG